MTLCAGVFIKLKSKSPLIGEERYLILELGSRFLSFNHKFWVALKRGRKSHDSREGFGFRACFKFRSPLEGEKRVVIVERNLVLGLVSNMSW